MNTQTQVDEQILVREDGPGYATLRLNRPQQFNSLSEPLLDALLRELQTLARQPEVRCVVLAAAGKAFCAGHDLREMRATPKLEYYQRLFTHCGRVMQAIRDVPVPVIARVHGVATAAGCQLVAACDLAVGSASGALRRLRDQCRPLLLDALGCPLAQRVGQARVRPPGHRALHRRRDGEGLGPHQPGGERRRARRDGCSSWCGRSSPRAPRPSVMARRSFYQQRELDLPQAYALAADVMAHNMMEDDAGEGIDAFLQKRAAVWKP